MTEQPYATSTVAMTAYFVICRHGRSAGLKTLREQVAQHLPHWGDDAQLEEALAELLARGVAKLEDGRYDVLDPRRRPVVRRNRDQDEGWAGWMVRGQMGLELLPMRGGLDTNALDEVQRELERVP